MSANADGVDRDMRPSAAKYIEGGNFQFLIFIKLSMNQFLIGKLEIRN